ncbi:beta-lactamase family protein [Candidatus Babeliales bacterium]|nr:beta-lactamase family protein [Candidatus Babeliales bacterium]
MIFPKKRSFIFASLFFTVLCSVANFYSPLAGAAKETVSDTSETAIQLIDTALQQLAAQQEFAGSVLITRNGTALLRKAYGLADDAQGIPNTPDTAFGIGSITKSFTAVLILQLAQEGKLSVDDCVSTVIPDYPHKTITIYQLLTHTTGCPNDLSWEVINAMLQEPKPIDEILQRDKKIFLGYETTLRFEPGTDYEYSNIGYRLLGEIIEKVDGCSYEQSLQSRIFDKLGMHNTFASYETYYQAAAHRTVPLIAQKPAYPMFAISATYDDFMQKACADGSIKSTVDDVYLWAQAVKQGTLLSPEYAALLKKPFLNNYACGLEVEQNETKSSISHNGLISHFTSALNIINLTASGNEIVMILLLNNGMAPITLNLISEILLENKTPQLQIFDSNSSQEFCSKYAGLYEVSDEKIESEQIEPEDNNSLLFTRTGKDHWKQYIRFLYSTEHDAWGSNVFNMLYKFVVDTNGNVVGIQNLEDQDGTISKKIS